MIKLVNVRRLLYRPGETKKRIPRRSWEGTVAAQTGLTIIKRFTYRGDATEEYSNQYWLTGSVPADSAAWTTLFNAVVAVEKTVYDSSVKVVAGYGYASDADDAVAVWSTDLHASPVLGTLTGTSGEWGPGDSAVWERWKTSRINSRGKPIYLRKYFHRAAVAGSGDFDTVATAQRTSLGNLGALMDGGTLPGSAKITARGHTDVILSHASSQFVTTRTLKRRGRRPTG